MMPVETQRELLPMRDPQQQARWRPCPVCGREIYGPEGICIYCIRFRP